MNKVEGDVEIKVISREYAQKVLDELNAPIDSWTRSLDPATVHSVLVSMLSKRNHDELVQIAASFLYAKRKSEEEIEQLRRSERAADLIIDLLKSENQLDLLIEVSEAVVSAKRNGGKAAVAGRKTRDPKWVAMAQIEIEFRTLVSTGNKINNAAFARKMADKYPEIANEGSIRNACTKWRKAMASEKA